MRCVTNTQLPSKTNRHLILIDIENLAASPAPTCGDVEAVLLALQEAIPSFDDDQRIVACSHHAAGVVAFAVPRARHIWRSGTDGADLALLDVLENERVAERYERVTICSGDGIFATTAARLAGSGVEVTVVSLLGHLAARLELAAGRVTFLAPVAAVAVMGTGA